jgi:hypothetical protein
MLQWAEHSRKLFQWIVLLLYHLTTFLHHRYLTHLFFFLLAELLRVIRRLNLKEQWTDLSLHFITLYSLRSTISENTRAQNHFRSIGGLEVLLDGLGLPSSKFSVSKQSFVPSDERYVFHQWQNQTFDVVGSEVWNREL